MGTPIDVPVIEYGPDCNRCPVQFPAGETPRFVYVYFDGIVDCGRSHHPAPNGQTFVLEQIPPNPCNWYSDGDIWKVDWLPNRIGAGDSLLTLLDHHGAAFFSGSELKCPSDPAIMQNDMHACAGFFAGSEGLALVTRHQQVIALVVQFGLEAGIHLMWEVFHHPDGGIVHKFADLHQRTNIRFKLEP